MLAKHFMLIMAALLGWVGGQAAMAQGYPQKPVRIIAAEPGGPSDVTARLIAAGLGSGLGQQFVVENRGGSGLIPGEVASKAAPDGYTLLVYTGNLWISPILSQKSPYDSIKDFAPVTLVARIPNVLVVNPALQVSSTRDLIALAKSKPGQLNFGSGPPGSASYLSGMMFRFMAGLDVQHIQYKGSQQGLVDLIAGRIEMFFPSAASVAPQIKSGKVKPLAITSATASSLMPDLQPVAAAVPGFNNVAVIGMWAPGRTPEAIVRRLNQEAVKVLNAPETKGKFLGMGAEVVASAPEQLGEAQKTDMERLQQLVKAIGLGAINLD